MKPEFKDAWDTIMDLSRMCCSDKHNDAMIEIERLLFKGIQDTERMDYLNKNFFHREMDSYDTRLRGETQTMWVTFGPKGVQGSIRDVVDAQMESERYYKDSQGEADENDSNS